MIDLDGTRTRAPSKTIRGGRRGQGDRGEGVALAHLESRGYALLDRGWTCRAGELDLVMRAPDGVIALVEVKTAYSDAAGDPGEWVTATKRKRICRAALEWLTKRDALDQAARFDLVLVRPDSEPEHIEDAFPFSE